MDALNEIGGNTVLTSESSLQGERTTGIDNYVGTYSANMRTFQKRNICLAVLMLKESREMN